jgi:hypothetical protein
VNFLKQAKRHHQCAIAAAPDSTQVWMSQALGDLPIIIDSGASVSLSPVKSDFAYIQPCNIKTLQGLKEGVDVVGEGLVIWSVRDRHGVCR